MISKEITDRIVVVGTDPGGKGGIASVIKTQRGMMESFNFIKIHQSGLRKFILPALGCIKALKYAGARYRVAHVHSASFSDFYRSSIFVLLFKLMGKKVVLHMHGAKFEQFYGSGKPFVKFVFRNADRVATVSNYFVRYIKSVGLNENVDRIWNSIPDRETPALKTPHDVFTLSYFGALDDRKGIFSVVEAIGENVDRFRGQLKLIIGGNGDIARLNALIDKYNLSDTVEFLGWLDADAKSRLLARSDVFIHPSVFESFGISILEAMDFGLPVITCPTGGITDLVVDGENGIMVQPNNKKQIVAAITKLMNDTALRTAMGEKSALFAQKFYNSSIEKDLEALYSALLL